MAKEGSGGVAKVGIDQLFRNDAVIVEGLSVFHVCCGKGEKEKLSEKI